MNRWLMIGSLAVLLMGSTGCLHHNVKGGCNNCNTCSTGNCNSCNSGACGSGACGDGCNTGILGQMAGLYGDCNTPGCRTGCQAGPLGWQQGGHDYSSHLHPSACGHHAGRALANRPYTPGPPSAQVGYPYYTVRGPRDFLLDNPPTIGR